MSLPDSPRPAPLRLSDRKPFAPRKPCLTERGPSLAFGGPPCFRETRLNPDFGLTSSSVED